MPHALLLFPSEYAETSNMQSFVEPRPEPGSLTLKICSLLLMILERMMLQKKIKYDSQIIFLLVEKRLRLEEERSEVIFKLANARGGVGPDRSEHPTQPSVGLLERSLDLKTEYLLELLGLRFGQST